MKLRFILNTLRIEQLFTTATLLLLLNIDFLSILKQMQMIK